MVYIHLAFHLSDIGLPKVSVLSFQVKSNPLLGN